MKHAQEIKLQNTTRNNEAHTGSGWNKRMREANACTIIYVIEETSVLVDAHITIS
jgi:hypothetical protein